MFSQLQGKRPVVSQRHSQQTPMNQQQSRSFTHPSHNSMQVAARDSLQRYPGSTQPRQVPPAQPRSQIEALPPSSTPLGANSYTASQLSDFMVLQQKLERDPSMRHPMFFTDRVRKAPNGVVVGEGVGSGYVFEDKQRRRLDGDCRL